MVAYSFQKQFRAPILARTKEQTIRADRKRHARPGEELQLYTGMRTRQCAIIGRATCLSISPITIHATEHWIETATGRMTDRPSLDLFAVTDGFADWAAMRAFWLREHPDAPIFSGMVVRWDALQVPPDPPHQVDQQPHPTGSGN